MSTEKNTPDDGGGSNPATAASAPPKKKQQQPSLYARKLLQKVSTLHPNASLESRQTIASWMVFNRKKCEGMGEGLLLAITNESSASTTGTVEAARLMLLLRIIHQVLLSNCPGGGAGGEGDAGDADKWEKSSQLRSRLGEITIMSLWKALAASFEQNEDATMVDQYQSEVKGMIEEWKEHNLFGGPTVWEEYKKGWSRALKEAIDAKGGGEGTTESTATVVAAENIITTKSLTEEDDACKEEPIEQADQTSVAKESNQNDKTENVVVDTVIAGESVDKKEEKTDADEVDVESIPAPPAVVENRDGKAVRATKRDSILTVDVEVDFEGVEEAKVEPSQFLDACKVIASIQITRDLGSDAAMNLSSALSTIPPELEEACNTILTQQQNGQDETTPITDLLSADSLSNLPDEVLDLDLKYARKSLQTYKEAIRQQQKARLQCLQLLLQSRCSFGSMDAARAFCGGDGSDVSMDVVLEKLKKRKEILVDAMALEGLDVEEDEEEKTMEKEEEALKPLSWFPGQNEEGNDGTEEERAAKKIKSC